MSELEIAVVGLQLAAIAGAGGVIVWFFKVVPGWLERLVEAQLKRIEAGLTENTRITTATHKAANGALSAAVNEAQKYRSAYERYARLVRELNNIEAARPYLDQAAQAMRVVEHDASFAALQRRLLGEEPTP